MPSANCADFPNGRLAFQPDTKNVSGSVHIAIVRRPAFRTIPASYSKRTHTFGAAAGDNPATRARLGTIPFVSLYKHSPVPAGLVAEHVPERRPSSVPNGFRHSGFRKICGVRIADDDQRILPHQSGAGDVEIVTAGIGDLGVYRSNAALIPCALRIGKRAFKFAVMTKRVDFLSVAHCRQVRQTQVNTYHPVPGSQIIRHVAFGVDIPAPAGILDERPSLEHAIDFARFPETEAPLQINSGVPVDPNSAWDEWYPAERTTRSEACSEMRAPTVQVSGRRELTADRLNCIRVQPKLGSASSAEFDQLKRGRPANMRAQPTAFLCLSLSRDAKIPHLITGNGMAGKMLAAGPILDAEFESDDAHVCSFCTLNSTHSQLRRTN